MEKEIGHSYDVSIDLSDDLHGVERTVDSSKLFGQPDGGFDCAGTFGCAGSFGGTLGSVGTFGCCC